MKISKYFKLNKTQFELDFVDIDISTDIPLFLDPYYISKCDFPFAIEAHRYLKNYFDYLLFLLKSEEYMKAQSLFSYLGETNELCLGFSANKPQGKGMGPTDTNRIFANLKQSRALSTGLMEDIEDFRIFVDNVDKDKVSDMTANIVKWCLIEYTQNQCRLWGIPLTPNVSSGHFWNRQDKIWDNVYTEMLVMGSKKVLLVPKRVVSFSTEYTPQNYMQHFVLNFLQNEHLHLNSELVQYRKNKKQTRFVTKKSIKEKIQKTSVITKDWLANFTLSHPEVFKDFKIKTKGKLVKVKKL